MKFRGAATVFHGEFYGELCVERSLLRELIRWSERSFAWGFGGSEHLGVLRRGRCDGSHSRLVCDSSRAGTYASRMEYDHYTCCGHLWPRICTSPSYSDSDHSIYQSRGSLNARIEPNEFRASESFTFGFSIEQIFVFSVNLRRYHHAEVIVDRLDIGYMSFE